MEHLSSVADAGLIITFFSCGQSTFMQWYSIALNKRLISATVHAGYLYFDYHQGAKPQRVSTEIIIEIKQLYSGQIALNPFIASNCRYMVFPLRDHLFIENGLLD